MRPNILCPVDFSAHSRRALRYAATLAARSEGTLAVLFVEDPLLFAVVRNPAVAKQDLRRQLQRFVTRALRVGPDAMRSIALEIAVGKPAEQIERTVRRRGCNLIVMGSHGLTGATHLLMGSTTDKVIRAASIPVLAIPPSRRHSRPLETGAIVWPARARRRA
jgi:nucleotide-binding universal stress UspA family protein